MKKVDYWCKALISLTDFGYIGTLRYGYPVNMATSLSNSHLAQKISRFLVSKPLYLTFNSQECPKPKFQFAKY